MDEKEGEIKELSPLFKQSGGRFSLKRLEHFARGGFVIIEKNGGGIRFFLISRQNVLLFGKGAFLIQFIIEENPHASGRSRKFLEEVFGFRKQDFQASKTRRGEIKKPIAFPKV